ncbi:DNA-directed RNA polymerase subunit delta [Mycoplasmatota bacterium WC30]
MTDRKTMSIMELAFQILMDHGKAMTFVELYETICAEKGISEEERAETVSQVYSDFITSAKFIYVGDDEWDIKGRQTIDLWDKDGAYYDEYPDYEEELSQYDENNKTPDEYSIEPVVTETEEESESVYEADFKEEDIKDDDVSEYDDFVEDDEDYIEEVADLVFDEDEKEKEKEEPEEGAEEFDDEEYNEYMDDYEQMYED